MLDKLAKMISKHCKWLGIVAILSTVVPCYFLRDAKIDNSIEVWLKHESKEYKTYQNFLERYKSEEFIVIAFQTDDPFASDAIELQSRLAEKLSEVQGVAKVTNLADVLKSIPPNILGLSKQIKKSKVFQNLLISEDGKTAGIFIWFDKIDQPENRRKTVEAIEAIVNKFKGPDFDPHLAGAPLMNVDLDRGSQQASRTFLPIALAISLVVLIMMLRSVSGVIAPMLAVGVTTAWTMGIMVMMGRTMNMVTVVLPSLLFILSLSSGIHITSRFFALLGESGDRAQAIRETVRELISPVFLSSITTAAGFGSLMISEMKPVADFGLFAAIGMLFSFLFNILVVPGMLSLLHVKSVRKPVRIKPHFSSRLGVFTAQRKWPVLLLSVALLAACIVTATKARVESNVLKFFPDDSRISKDYEFIGKNLTGFYTVELEFLSELSQEPSMLAKMSELDRAISNRPGVARCIYNGNIDLFSSLEIPKLSGAFDAGFKPKPFENMLGHYRVEEDEQVFLRMSVLINAMASLDFYSLLSFIDEEVEKVFGDTNGYTITGVVPLLNDVQMSLVDTQIRSFSIAAIVVLVMIGIFMRSFRAVIASILPNLLPIFAMFAMMVLLDIPLDAATVMIASVAIGIAADDTIHFLSQYKCQRSVDIETVPAIEATLCKIGRAIVFTSVVATAGFSILCKAEFKPIGYFGMLTAITMITALAGDILILPACLGVLNLWKKK